MLIMGLVIISIFIVSCNKEEDNLENEIIMETYEVPDEHFKLMYDDISYNLLGDEKYAFDVFEITYFNSCPDVKYVEEMKQRYLKENGFTILKDLKDQQKMYVITNKEFENYNEMLDYVNNLNEIQYNKNMELDVIDVEKEIIFEALTVTKYVAISEEERDRRIELEEKRQEMAEKEKE